MEKIKKLHEISTIDGYLMVKKRALLDLISDKSDLVKLVNEGHTKKAVEAVYPFLYSKIAVVRATAIYVLGELGSKEAAPEIVRCLSDNTWFVREKAVEALQKLFPVSNP